LTKVFEISSPSSKEDDPSEVWAYTDTEEALGQIESDLSELEIGQSLTVTVADYNDEELAAIKEVDNSGDAIEDE
jgi:hypothetical protein